VALVIQNALINTRGSNQGEKVTFPGSNRRKNPSIVKYFPENPQCYSIKALFCCKLPLQRDPPPPETLPEPVIDRGHPPTKIAQEGPRPTMPRNNGLLDSALRAPLHAMDCVDVLVGAVRDGRTRVQDSYSRDRSTPLEDFLG
ncbi:hypothetical protein OESDEN_22914, partial [Oesophagostomum dentatum]